VQAVAEKGFRVPMEAQAQVLVEESAVLVEVLSERGLERKDRTVLVIRVQWAVEVERVPELVRVVLVEVPVFREPWELAGVEALQEVVQVVWLEEGQGRRGRNLALVLEALGWMVPVSWVLPV